MHAVKTRQLMLLTGDSAVLFLSLAITLLVRYGFEELASQFGLHAGPMALIFLVWLIILYVNGMYDLYIAKPSQTFLRRFAESWIILVGVAVALFYLLPIFVITPKTNLFLLSAVFGLLFVMWRLAISRFSRADIRVLAIDPDADVLTLLHTLQHNPQLGHRIVGILVHDKASAPTSDTTIQRFSDVTPIRAIVSEHHVNLVLIPTHLRTTHALLYGELYELLFWNVYTMPSEIFFESLTGRIPLSALHDSWFFENLRPNRLPLYDALRRIMDVALAIVGIVLLMIITPIITLFVTWKSPGPIFFKQERIGRNGKKFNVIKFRTMHALTKDGSAEISGAQMTTSNDPRVTAFGAYIRTLRLDELPQVLNVLRGDMSFIGPRPERPQFVAEFEKHMPYYTVRHLVKPGLSGWAQINYPYAETVKQQLTKFQYDLFYIKNRSFLLDLTIILKTLHVVLYGKGR